MNDSTKNYDIIIYGATGYTGQLVAEYFAKNYSEQHLVTWAIAGRSMEKLQQISKQLNCTVDCIVAQSDDLGSLMSMVKKAQVIITTVGPYQLYGELLVKACVETGTDYVDLCGEPLWMRNIIDNYSDAARDNGARIVHSCGFDSIPFDLGVLFLQQQAQQALGQPFTKIRGRVKQMNGTFSGGTAASFQATMAAVKQDPSLFSLLTNPFALTPGFTGAEQPSGNEVILEEDLNSWSAPFIMAAINTRNIHRTNVLTACSYGKNFVYDEMIFTGSGEQGKAMAEAVITQNSSFGGKNSPNPGEGPTKEEREAGNYEVLFIGSENGQTLTASVSADLDPGYGSTSKMLSEAAICLLKSSSVGGVLTPAAAMGRDLIEHLIERAGIKFSMV